jgi:RNA polymerase sigma-70 factor (ECF subfamily)
MDSMSCITSPPWCRRDAEDVVHRIFTRALGDGWIGIDDVDAYMRRAVRNECFDLLRRLRRRRTEDIAPLLEAVSAASPSRDEQVLVEQVLKVLSAEQREVVHLKVFEGHTLAEIAAICGVPMNTVASRYRYALIKMREALGPHD